MKKNVLQLIGSFHQGGSERQAIQLTRLLSAEGSVNVRVATLNREGALLGEVESLGLGEIPEFRLNSFYELHFVKQVRRFAGYLRANAVDILQTHDFYTNIFGMAAARLAGIRLRVAAKRETGGMRTPMQDRIERVAFAGANRIVVNSLAVREHLIGKGITDSKIAVIRNGLDLGRLDVGTRDASSVRSALGLPETGRLITLVANLRHRVKNQPMFIRAAARVVQDVSDARFVIAGEGDLRDPLEALARELGVDGRVHLIGRCARVPELLAASYAGVLTSFNEGFSNSILEYMAARLPVVATNVGGAAEAIADGETGFLVPSDDDAALARKLVELLADEAKAAAAGRAGRERVERDFSCEAQLARTLELYRAGADDK